jgi:hypothetical protein
VGSRYANDQTKNDNHKTAAYIPDFNKEARPARYSISTKTSSSSRTLATTTLTQRPNHSGLAPRRPKYDDFISHPNTH